MKLTLEQIKQTPFRLSILIIYYGWWIYGLLDVVKRPQSNFAGGARLFFFLETSLILLISQIVLSELYLLFKPSLKIIYRKYYLLTLLPFTLFIAYFIFAIIIATFKYMS